MGEREEEEVGPASFGPFCNSCSLEDAQSGLVGFPRWVTALGVWYGMVWYGTVRYGQEQYITGMDGNIQDPTVIFLNWTKQGDGE